MTIFESPDRGKTIYKRKLGQTQRELVQSPNSVFTFNDYVNISELAKTNESLQKALDHLLLLYYTIKNDSKTKT